MANIIREAVSGIAGVFATGFDTLVQELGEPDRLSLQAKPSTSWPVGGVMAYGETNPSVPAIVGDKTIAVKANVPDADFAVLWECAAMRLTCTPDGGGWKAGALVFTADGTASCLSGVLDLDVDYHLAATYEAATGELVLYVDGDRANDTSFGEARDTITPLPIWRMGGPPEAVVTDGAVWSRVLDPGEVPAVPHLRNIIAWWDASNASTTTTFVEDLIGGADLAGSALQGDTIGSLSCVSRQTLISSGFLKTTASPLSGLTAFGVTIVYQDTNGGPAVHVDTRETASARFSTYSSPADVHMVASNDVNVGVKPSGGNVLYFEVNGASSKYFVNGVQIGGSVNLGAVTAASATLRFLQNYLENQGLSGGVVKFGEAKLTTGQQLDADILAEANALSAKWGI